MPTEYPSDLGFTVLYDEGPCLVVNKPAGLLTQAPLGIDSLELRVKRFIKQCEGKTGEIYLGVPHRLDRPVSGAIVFARHVRAARKISEQFEGRTVSKTYWALVGGQVAEPQGTWTDFLKKIDGEPRTVIVDEHDVGGKLAILHYRVIQVLPHGTLLEIELETGRTHQIRVQCSSRGLPLLGDTLYGSPATFGPWSNDERERFISLHARNLKLKHPMTREPIDINAPLPPLWQDYGVS
ncbi:tRNA pseudouridine synthase C [Anatilimnocola aggregata]|uniref:tRNA pseudouridine synthase C n=1 Tax=Anatilimnocola aggregata TaxID=2528021 RepID=A0A517Y7V5_9BACT|nr:RluA family pseudouridine synthase [Anatilimnocola aggregata]QDU26313.1 tRNA pseudouridine synthase C [Anatilimnocola aggregata]